MCHSYIAEVLFRPGDERLGYLPEGPYALGPDRFSWVAIQHGPQARTGSLNIFNLTTRRNQTWELDGRPGFAYPTNRENVFVVGREKRVGFFDVARRRWAELWIAVEEETEGTIINDGLIAGDAIIFGTKDIEFLTPKAGLYFWRPATGQLNRLTALQTCSNGKEILEREGQTYLLDIDTPQRSLVEYPLDPEAGKIGQPRTVLSFHHLPGLPDGMTLTPDRRSAIIALFNPGEATSGEARQFNLATGALECIWQTPGSPQVTCPLLIPRGPRVELVLTTAVEHMPAAKRERAPNAGCLFIAETPLSQIPPAALFPLPENANF